jgi:PhzF family phenazine biosynthesis protein
LLASGDLPYFTDELRQIIAGENNLSETAYVETLDREAADDFGSCTTFLLRWFTPVREVPLCGHATLAAAAALFLGEGNPAPALRFHTLSGELTVARYSTNPTAFLMTLPCLPATPDIPPETGIGSDLVHAAVAELPVARVLYCAPLKYLLIVLERQPEASMAAFSGMKPDITSLARAHTAGALVGVIVTLQADGVSGHDFYSRFFAPWAGIDEDPVTGSAHSVLAPYWAEVLGKDNLTARQCSARGGELALEVGHHKEGVVLTGNAAVVIKGEMYYSG